MAPTELKEEDTPQPLREKLAAFNEEIHALITKAESFLTTELIQPVQLSFSGKVFGRDIITDYERAQQISFVSRFDHLPDECPVYLQKVGDAFYISNISEIRHTLNEYRPIIINENDPVYYQKLHNFCATKLKNKEGEVNKLCLRAKSFPDIEATVTFLQWIGDRNKAMRWLLEQLEFDYIYNGILQHHDDRFSKRFMAEYTSGELNFIFWKHAHILGFLKELIRPYYQVVHYLTFPKLGPLWKPEKVAV